MTFTKSILKLSLAFFAGGSAALGQTIYTGPGTYQQIGPYTYGPNGSTQQEIGPYTYVTPQSGQPSTSYQNIGPFTFGSDGSSHQQIGSFSTLR